MKIHLTWFVAVAVAVFLFAPRVEAAQNDAAGVQSAVAAFATTWNRHDMVAFGKLFATDADFVTVSGGWHKGRDDIQMHHAYLHGTIPVDTPRPMAYREHYGIFKNSTMQFDQIDVRFVRRDVAIARVRWELHGDARTPVRRGLLMFVLARQGGEWLIKAAQNTEINRTVK